MEGKKHYIEVETPEQIYRGKSAQLSDSELELAKELIGKAVSGKLDYLNIEKEDGDVFFFGKEVLMKSVIAIRIDE